MQIYPTVVNSGCQVCGYFLVDLYFIHSTRKMHCFCIRKTKIYLLQWWLGCCHHTFLPFAAPISVLQGQSHPPLLPQGSKDDIGQIQSSTSSWDSWGLWTPVSSTPLPQHYFHTLLKAGYLEILLIIWLLPKLKSTELENWRVKTGALKRLHIDFRDSKQDPQLCHSSSQRWVKNI